MFAVYTVRTVLAGYLYLMLLVSLSGGYFRQGSLVRELHAGGDEQGLCYNHTGQGCTTDPYHGLILLFHNRRSGMLKARLLTTKLNMCISKLHHVRIYSIVLRLPFSKLAW